MTQTTQQRSGAQHEAAAAVRAREAEFEQVLCQLALEADGLRTRYRGPAADAFFVLVGGWLEDAEAIVADMERFADRLVTQDSRTDASQEQQMTGYTRATARLATTTA